MPADPRPLGAADLSAYDFTLPEGHIAQHGLPNRDAARLLLLDRGVAGSFRHGAISQLPRYLDPGDLLVINTSRVVPARLSGRKISGGRADALLLGPAPLPEAGAPGEDRATYRALVGCRGRLRVGLKLRFDAALDTPGPSALEAEIVEVTGGGEVVLAFPPLCDPYAFGQAPLPPYIGSPASATTAAQEHLERYQTVYALEPGSVAAPTAGLHFTPRLLAALSAAGVEVARCVLHVGPGTFRPLGGQELASGRLHPEHFELPLATADAIARTRAEGRRVIAVGTTTARVLESCSAEDGQVEARSGVTDLFLRPGDRFRTVDALLTNFHLPRSSLLLLVSAFAGRRNILDAYAEAIREGYRFYSYGDAMLIL